MEEEQGWKQKELFIGYCVKPPSERVVVVVERARALKNLGTF